MNKEGVFSQIVDASDTQSILDVLAMLHRVDDARVCSETGTEKSTGILSMLFWISRVITATEPDKVYKKAKC